MLQEDDVDFSAFVNAVESTERKDAQANNTQKGFDFPVCVGIGNKAIVRFVNGIAETALDQGAPGSGRAKLFNIGWVRDDDNKPFLLTLPAIINNKPMYNSTMVEFIDKVLSRAWVDNPNPTEGGAKGEWKYFYADRDDYGQQSAGYKTLKQIFWDVYKSGAQPSNQYYKSQKSWRGQTVYIANVIDRLDYNWHKENKKTKLLMRSLKVKDGVLRHKEVSSYAISSPLRELADNHGVKLNYDVLIVPGAQPMDKFTLKNVSKLKEKDYWDDVKSVITENDKAKISIAPGFTDEEKTWEPIDIGKYYRFTSAATILKHFSKTIQAFDMMVGTNFYDRFKAEAEADAKVRKENAATDKASTATQAAPKVETPTAPTAPVTPTAAPVTNPVTQPTAPVAQPQPVATPTPEPAPEPMQASAEAQESIDAFYSSLD